MGNKSAKQTKFEKCVASDVVIECEEKRRFININLI